MQANLLILKIGPEYDTYILGDTFWEEAQNDTFRPPPSHPVDFRCRDRCSSNGILA